MKKMLPPEVVMEIMRLHSARKPNGMPLHSMRAIGKTLGVSATTVFNVVNGYEAYMGETEKAKRALAPVTPEDQAAADASLARLQGLLKGEGK